MGERDTPLEVDRSSPADIVRKSEICVNDLSQLISGRSPQSLEGFLGGALTAAMKEDLVTHSFGEARVSHLKMQCLVQGCDTQADYLVIQMPLEEAKIMTPLYSHIALSGCKKLKELNEKFYPKLANKNDDA